MAGFWETARAKKFPSSCVSQFLWPVAGSYDNIDSFTYGVLCTRSMYDVGKNRKALCMVNTLVGLLHTI